MDAINDISTSLEWPDYVIISAVLLISALIGIYYRFTGGQQRTTAEYFSANNTMSIPLLAVALMVAFMSAIALLGMSAETYVYGAIFMVWNVGFIFGAPIVAFLYLPVFFKLQIFSVYEYLELRFGVTARLAASITHYAQSIVHAGIVLYTPALALEATTGLSSTASVFAVGLVCSFYTSIGGIKAVLATDVFQGGLMAATVFCVIGIGCYDLEGGISEVWNIAQVDGRLNFFNFSLDPTERYTWMTLVLGGIGFFVANFGIDQVHIQRLLTARSLKSAQTSVILTTPLLILMMMSTSFSGLVLYAWFRGCDPLASGKISSDDQLMPHFAKVRLSKVPGLLGFFIAGIFSAALSCVSALLSALAAVAVADYIKPIYRKLGRECPDSRVLLFGKALGFINGVLCMGTALLASQLGSVMETALTFGTAVGGPILGLFTLGMFVEVANEKGALIGTLLSLAFSVLAAFGQPRPPVPELLVSLDECFNFTHLDTLAYRRLQDLKDVDESEYFYLYRISFMLYCPLGVLTTLILGTLASIIVRCFSKTAIPEPNPDLFAPFLAARMMRRREKKSQVTTAPIFTLQTKVSVS